MICAPQVTERLATVKQTRELLLQNPNSTGAVPWHAEATQTRRRLPCAETHQLPCPFCAVFFRPAAHLQLGKVKTVRKPTTSSENVGDGSPSRVRPSRPRRAAPASAPPARSPLPMGMTPQMAHGMMPGMEGASMGEAQRCAAVHSSSLRTARF